MTERALTTLFAKFLKSHPREYTEVYEFKMVKGQTFPFKSVQPHQIEGLKIALTGLWYKIQDSPFGGSNQRFTSKKPFDGIWIKARRGYICPIFWKPRRYKKVFLIPVDKFVKFKGKSIRMPDLEKMNFQTFYL